MMGRFTYKSFLYISVIFFQTLFIIYLLVPPNEDPSSTTRSITVEIPSQRQPCLCIHGNKHNSTLSPQSSFVHTNKIALDYSLKNNSRRQVYLLVIIISSPKGRERRDTIRQTWANINTLKYSNYVKIKFSIGTQGLLQDDLFELNTENAKYSDLLLLNNIVDSYHNLTLKVLWTFVHVVHHFNITYLFKGDDDTFVLLDIIIKELIDRDLRTNRNHDDNLFHDLYSPSSNSYYWGFFNGRARVKRKGKWTEKEWFLSSNYLPYALGGGYIISGDLIHSITINANRLQLYHSEDVSVGVWLSPFKAERRHDVRFNTQFVSRGCRNVYIVSHKQSIDDMKSKYDNMLRLGVQCLHEYQTKLSYDYNWTVPPLECCQLKEGIP